VGSGAPEADDPIERLIAETRAANKGRRFCSNCGAALEGSGRFCVECGAKA
jgi:predicted amidophosphoribosyltransferase